MAARSCGGLAPAIKMAANPCGNYRDGQDPSQFTEGQELGRCRPCFVVQMVSMSTMVLTGYQKKRDVAP